MNTQKKLIETYQKAQKKLVEIIKRKQAYGSAAAYERSLLRQIQKELKKLKKSSKALVEQLIKENYKTGLQSLIDDLLKDNTAPRLFNMFSGLNTSQIELITQNANIDLNKSINIVGRRMQDAVREAGIEATAEKLTTGQTVREMQKNLEKKLEQQNLTAVEYANGTKMPIEKYAETVARSTTAETQNKAKVIQGQDWGYDLVRFTEHSHTCEVCSMYQGRVYALTKEAANGKYKGSKGQELHFPYLYDTALISGYSTIHPNCRHRLSVLPAGAYTAAEMEEFSRKSMQHFEDMRSDQERKAYAKEQEVKRKRNESRKQYEKIKAALPNDAPKTFAAFVKMKSAKSERYKELLKDYRTVIGIAKEQESGIIKNIELPPEIEKIKSMAPETKDLISKAIDEITSQYIVRLDKVEVIDLGNNFKTTPFQYQPYFENDKLKHKLVINNGYYFNDSQDEFQARILRNYNRGVLAAKSVEDLIAHEMAHIMTFQDLNSEGGLLLENKRLQNLYVPGVSLYADASLDGAETIAEAFVRLRNNEKVPDEAISLVKEYIERWHK